jgi:hypothetical protein
MSKEHVKLANQVADDISDQMDLKPENIEKCILQLNFDLFNESDRGNDHSSYASLITELMAMLIDPEVKLVNDYYKKQAGKMLLQMHDYFASSNMPEIDSYIQWKLLKEYPHSLTTEDIMRIKSMYGKKIVGGYREPLTQ